MYFGAYLMPVPCVASVQHVPGAPSPLDMANLHHTLHTKRLGVRSVRSASWMYSWHHLSRWRRLRQDLLDVEPRPPIHVPTLILVVSVSDALPAVVECSAALALSHDLVPAARASLW